MTLKASNNCMHVLPDGPASAPPPWPRGCAQAATQGGTEHMHGILDSPWCPEAASKLASLARPLHFAPGEPRAGMGHDHCNCLC